MNLTSKQEQGLRIAVDRYRNKEPFTVISGYAGSGKSTLIQFIIEALDLDPSQVAYIAYTGHAAQVLRNKNCPNAMTAHRLLYKSIQRRDGSFMHIPLDDIGSYRLIVVDEVSMLPQEMWNLLLSHHKYVIACGDPGQLPPISGETTVLDHPHIFLDEIMRQAAESEIIRLSASIRAREEIKPFKGQEVNIVSKKDFIDGMLTWADQVICGKNATRYNLNDFFRKQYWGDALLPPQIGDKVICTRNNWEKITKYGDALVNGTIGNLVQVKTYPNQWLGTKCLVDFVIDDGLGDNNFEKLSVDYKLLTKHVPTVTKDNFKQFPIWLRPNLVEYGYAITAHKSQGSEYNKVLVLEEFLKNTDHARWLYTACTRAAQKLTLVLS